jgi:ABC-2 type transport system permease protein
LIFGYYNLFNIARYPDAIFRGMFKFIFSWIVPVLLVANVPARMLARTFEAPGLRMMQLVIATLFVVAATRMFWRFALTRYASASS